MEKKTVDIVIIGAGASGLMAAHFCGLKGKRVVLLEHNYEVGKKILISGGGRCNFTNMYSSPTDFVSKNPHFCKSALSRYTPYDFIDFVEKHDVDYHEKKLGQLFCDKSSKEIRAILLQQIQRDNIDLILNARDLKVTENQKQFMVANNELEIITSSLIIATGGLSVSAIGATDFGHQVAKQFGHKIIPPVPALVPFKLEGFSDLAGVSVVGRVSCEGHSIEEDILFTHKGLSGPAILKISLYWESGKSIEVNWLPKISLEDSLQKENSTVLIRTFLKKHLPNRFVDLLLDRSGISKDLRIIDLNKNAKDVLISEIHHMQLTPSGTEGFRKAEVTRGGVDTNQVSSKTMESQLRSGLYFIGEVLDVTGQLGGHNFQWAWASAHAVGSYLS